MKIINNSASLNLYDILNAHDDLYFRDLNVTTHSYSNSLVVIDLANAMKTGKRCPRWLLHCAPWHMDKTRLCLMEYIELAFPDCSTLADLMNALRSASPAPDVDGLTIETGEQPSNRTWSPFATIKPQKLGDRLNAATIAKAIQAGQIIAGRTDGRYTDDYAMDAAYNFYAGDIDLSRFAQDIYEHPSGWRFWWKDTERTELVAACHTFDYKTLIVA